MMSMGGAGCSSNGSGDNAGAPSGDGGACTVTVSPSADDQTTVEGALIDAKSGDTVCLATGRFTLTGELSLATPNVTLRGVDGTILDFTQQTIGPNGIELTADHDTLDTLRIENAKGPGIRATAVDYPTIKNIHVEWTNGPSPDNGGYGIYPVMSKHVLIDGCFASGASDTGIYVGQSSTIVIRNSEATGNVAGIEIENSTDAEVYNNHSHGNSGGILLFNLPGLDVKDGKRAHVHDNVIEDNNLMNFALTGNIVADVPTGTGMFILASDDNEVNANTIQNNESVGVTVVSWYLALRNSEGMADPAFDWYPERNYVHDNTFTNNGMSPMDRAHDIATLLSVTTITDMSWDGIVDSSKVAGDGGTADGGAISTADAGASADSGSTDGGGDAEGGGFPPVPEELKNCFHANGSATFINFDFNDSGAYKSYDLTPYDCQRPLLPPIDL